MLTADRPARSAGIRAHGSAPSISGSGRCAICRSGKDGGPEIRIVDRHQGYFNPWTNPQANKARVKEPPGNEPPPQHDPSSKKPPVNEAQIGAQCEQEPQLDEIDRFLVLLFFRRYVTYCARRARFAQMNGAAWLHWRIASSP